MDQSKVFLLNGIEKNFPATSGASVYSLFQYLYEFCSTESEVISSIKINGQEMAGKNEDELKHVFLDQVTRIEVLTDSSERVMEKTLDSLSQFLENLIQICGSAKESPGKGELYPLLGKIVEGIDLLSDTTSTVKASLRKGLDQKIRFLEIDLISIMRDLLDASQRSETEFVKELIHNDLQDNLNRWKNEGIPSLRDKIRNKSE